MNAEQLRDAAREVHSAVMWMHETQHMPMLAPLSDQLLEELASDQKAAADEARDLLETRLSQVGHLFAAVNTAPILDHKRSYSYPSFHEAILCIAASLSRGLFQRKSIAEVLNEAKRREMQRFDHGVLGRWLKLPTVDHPPAKRNELGIPWDLVQTQLRQEYSRVLCTVHPTGETAIPTPECGRLGSTAWNSWSQTARQPARHDQAWQHRHALRPQSRRHAETGRLASQRA